MKQLSLFIMIAAITMCATVAMAWDSGNKQTRTIKGDYYFVGGGPCLLSLSGFAGNLVPADPAGPWALSDSTWEGVYTFNHDGKGSFKAIYRVIERTSDSWPLGPYNLYAQAANVSWDFTYTLSKTGRITFTYKEGSYVGEWVFGPQTDPPNNMLYLYIKEPYYGVLSPDHLNILVTWGVPLQLTPTFDQNNETPMFSAKVICNAVQQGFRCNNKCPELVYTPEPDQ
jgi:hypothetical protein